MTQLRLVKILWALGLNKALTGLFLGSSYTLKRIFPTKVWIILYKLSMSLVF